MNPITATKPNVNLGNVLSSFAPTKPLINPSPTTTFPTPISATPQASQVPQFSPVTAPITNYSWNPPKVASTPPVIKASNVGATAPVVLPAPTPSTAQGTLSATSNSYMTPPPATTPDQNGYASTPPQNPNDLTSNANVLSRLSELENKLGGKTDTNNQLNTQFGVDQKQQAYIDSYNQYKTKDVQYRQQEDAILNKSGLSTEQAQQQLGVLQRNNNADRANLATIATAAQGNYQGALDIVKRKLDAQFEPVQAQIDNLGKFVELNNADLTTSQVKQIENQKFLLQNNLDALKTAKTNAHQFALTQGINDPQILNAIDQAQTPADVYNAVGGNVGGLPGTQGNSEVSSIAPQYQSYVTSNDAGVTYVNQDQLKNLTSFQQQEAARQYAQAGIKVLQPDEASKIQNIDVTKQNLAQLQGVTHQILGSGLGGRTIGATWNLISQGLQLNPNISSFNSYRDTAINTIQALAGGTGSGLRLNQTEIDTAASNIPKITDNLETADKKIELLNSFLDKWTHELVPSSKGNTQKSGDQIVQTKAGAINTNW